jgi:hypothetical protein
MSEISTRFVQLFFGNQDVVTVHEGNVLKKIINSFDNEMIEIKNEHHIECTVLIGYNDCRVETLSFNVSTCFIPMTNILYIEVWTLNEFYYDEQNIKTFNEQFLLVLNSFNLFQNNYIDLDNIPYNELLFCEFKDNEESILLFTDSF